MTVLFGTAAAYLLSYMIVDFHTYKWQTIGRDSLGQTIAATLILPITAIGCLVTRWDACRMDDKGEHYVWRPRSDKDRRIHKLVRARRGSVEWSLLEMRADWIEERCPGDFSYYVAMGGDVGYFEDDFFDLVPDDDPHRAYYLQIPVTGGPFLDAEQAVQQAMKASSVASSPDPAA